MKQEMMPPTIKTGIMFEMFSLLKSNKLTSVAPTSRARARVVTKHANIIKISNKTPPKTDFFFKVIPPFDFML